MPFPVSPNPGDSYTDAYGTVWIYAGSVNGWYRQEVIPGNETTYTGGGSGSATATGAAGEIQFTDGTNLAASPNLLWDDANDELEVTGDLKLLDGGNHTTTLQTITPTQNNTISLPNATGTVALVAGSSGQLLYNNAGANAGVSTFTADSSGRLTNSASSASGFPVKLWNGTIFAGTTPHVLVQPTGASTPTSTNAWSANGTALAVNTAAGFTGNLLDLQVNGTRVLSVNASTDTAFNIPTGGVLTISKAGNLLATFNNGADYLTIGNGGGIKVGTDVTLGDSTSRRQIRWPIGISLIDDAANTLAQRNGTNAQTTRIYDTYTSATDYHRIAIATARATLTGVSGASVTATGLIPAGAVVMGVTSKVTTALGTGNGTTGYKIGTGADADRWGAITGTAAGTTSDNRDWTAGTIECFPSATDVIVTATGGNFDGTGVIYLSVQYMTGQAD